MGSTTIHSLETPTDFERLASPKTSPLLPGSPLGRGGRSIAPLRGQEQSLGARFGVGPPFQEG